MHLILHCNYFTLILLAVEQKQIEGIDVLPKILEIQDPLLFVIKARNFFCNKNSPLLREHDFFFDLENDSIHTGWD